MFTLQPFVREVSYTIDDFIPVAALSNEPIIMIAGKDSGITSVDDLLEMDSVTYGFSRRGRPLGTLFLEGAVPEAVLRHGRRGGNRHLL